jgi:hypothetical protein
MEADKQKMLMIGGAAIVGIFVLSKLVGKDSSSGDTPPTPVISNIGASSDPNERYAIQASANLGSQQSKLAGLSSLLNYSTEQKTLDTTYALGIADLTNTAAIKNKELDAALVMNGQNVESQNLQARLQSETMLGVAAQEAAAQMAVIGGQVSIAGIMAGVESERTKADVTLGLRGFDSKDYETGSNERLGLARIDLEKFGITEDVGLQKYLADYGFILGKKTLKTERNIAQIGADRDVTINKDQTAAQVEMNRQTHKNDFWGSLFGAVGNIIPGFF